MAKEVKLKKDGTPKKSSLNKRIIAKEKSNEPEDLLTPETTEPLKIEAKQEVKVEEKRNVEPQQSDKVQEFNPFEGETKPLDHADYKVDEKKLQEIASKEIPEPKIIAPDVEFLEKQDKLEKQIELTKQQAEKEKIKEIKPPTLIDNIQAPGFEQMPKEEINIAAKQTTKLVFDFIKWLHKIGYDLSKISDEKLQRMSLKGEFDLELLEAELPLGLKTKTLSQLIKEYNETQATICTLDEEFVKDMMPVLIRVLAKHGWIISDELYIIIEGGKYLVEKAGACISTAIGFNTMLKQIMAQWKEHKEIETKKDK